MKKILSVFSALVLCLAVLAGCTGKSGVLTTAAPGDASSAPGETQSSAQPQADNTGLPISYIGRGFEEINKEEISGAFPCADVGMYQVIYDKNISAPLGLANHEDVTTSDLRIKTVYIVTRGTELERGVFTGQTYAEYAENPRIKDLTDLRYNKKVFSYSCTYPSEINGQKVTVWLFFDSPDSVCSSALITTLFFPMPPLSDTPEKPPQFLLQTIGKPAVDAMEKFGNGLSIHSEFSSDKYSVLTYGGGSEIMPGINDANLVKTVQVNSPSEYEILPGFGYGKTYGEYIAQGNTFLGEMGYNDDDMCKSTSFVIRVGAVNLECFIDYNDDETMARGSFICKQLAY